MWAVLGEPKAAVVLVAIALLLATFSLVMTLCSEVLGLLAGAKNRGSERTGGSPTRAEARSHASASGYCIDDVARFIVARWRFVLPAGLAAGLVLTHLASSLFEVLAPDSSEEAEGWIVPGALTGVTIIV